MKSPKQLRSDIQTLTMHLGQVRDALVRRSTEPLAQIGKECQRASEALGEILKTQNLPEDYKVAVVGRFKAGKSSFVNELLGARLAGEDTSPETAAITTFKHGDRVKATVHFVPKETWVGLQRLYEDDPKHIDAHRVKMWKNFAKPRKTADGQDAEPFDLKSLETQFVKAGGFSLTVELAAEGGKKAESEFRKRLKEFTSGSKPHHCLVEKIEITSPAEILDQGVLLIDTPGLDDTERFRVSLTEKAVEDVDAVLFLTKSGAAYGQSEKDFLLTLLRKGTVKQLIIVITQVDQTYEQYLKACLNNDEDPDSISLRIERERIRIIAEISATLDDLSSDDSPAMRRYREQLGEVGLAFTSAQMHRDWKAGRPVPYALEDNDPGGVESLKHQLLHLLSTESRLALAAQGISVSAKGVLLDLQEVLHKKLLAIRGIKDKEVAEKKLNTFRVQFGEGCERFKGAVEQQVELLRDRLAQNSKQRELFIENIGLLAEQQLAAFESDDVGRHWRTRRSGYWGYMRGLQQRVANRIFPKVQELLAEQTELFAVFTRDFEVFLGRLSADGAAISAELELGAAMPFDVTAKLKESLERSIERANELIGNEELQVMSLLDDFVTDEVSDKISERRDRVSNIFGQGTTVAQSQEVRAFYRDVKALLQEALANHLRARCKAFGDFLMNEAAGAPRDALNEVHTLLEQAADNIRAAAAAVVVGQKDAAESLTHSIDDELKPVLLACDTLFEATQDIDSGAVAVAPESQPSTVQTEERQRVNLPDELDSNAWFVELQQSATNIVRRHRLRDGVTGWPFERVFEAELLKGCNKVVIIDPYLAAHHQIRNLNELLLLIAEVARPKEIAILTAFAPPESVGHQDRALDNTATDLFKNFGVTLTIERQTGLHDRYVMFDHGVLFKLGRGLDIYKPATGLAAHRPASRRVRQTEIDVFVPDQHALLEESKNS